MTPITLPRAVVEQALEALTPWMDSDHTVQHAAYHALRAALAQQAEQAWVCPESPEHRYTKPGHCEDCGKTLVQQAEPVEPVEPVAWSGYDLDGMVEAFSRVIEARYQRANPFQNPIDMDAQMALRILRGFIPAMKAYTAPPHRKPLTDEDIERIFMTYQSPRQAARAVERAHGITDPQIADRLARHGIPMPEGDPK